MASPGPINTQEGRGGHECEFVISPPVCLQTECSVCLLVLRSPHLASCCGHNFCKECIERIQKAGKNCPLCNAEQFILTYNRTHDAALKQFEVYCTHRTRDIGCEWKGKLEMLDKHLNVNPESEKQLEGCVFVEVQCCHDGCGQCLKRRLIAKHQTEECTQRPFTCEHCRKYKATYHDITINHWPMCKSYPLPCPNKCTQSMIQRQYLEQHLNEECPLQEVECEFRYAGCKTKLLRKDMPEHLKENLVGHMSLLARQNQELTAKLREKEEIIKKMAKQSQREMDERIRILEQKHDATSSSLEKLHHHVQIAPVRLVMAKFEEQKKDNYSWHSKPFSTHPQGYSLSLRVDVNGFGDGKGTHVSCFVHLNRSKFDNNLQWPFRGSVTIQLLNQLEDRNHRSMTVVFDEQLSAEYTSRVTSRQRAVNGRGMQTFVPHRELGHNAATNCQYLMDDRLCFQVKVELN